MKRWLINCLKTIKPKIFLLFTLESHSFFRKTTPANNAWIVLRNSRIRFMTEWRSSIYNLAYQYPRENEGEEFRQLQSIMFDRQTQKVCSLTIQRLVSRLYLFCKKHFYFFLTCPEGNVCCNLWHSCCKSCAYWG